MYPLNVILVGCGGELVQLLKLELSVHAVRVEAEYLGVESTISALRQGEMIAGKNGRSSSTATSGETTKRLFIVHLDSAQELPAIKRLSSFFPGHPILVLIDARGDANIPIMAMRMGASQVVTLPLQADDFKLALDCIGNQFGAPGQNQVIAIAGVTGGCGATTLAINIAYEISQAHPDRRVVLAELSLQMGKLPLYLNVEPRYTTYDLLKDIHRLDLYFMQQALTPIVDQFSVLTGPYHAVTPLSVSSADVLLLVECLQQIADIIVLDVPCTYDSIYFDTLHASDQVLLVGEQKVPSIRAFQMVAEKLEGKPVQMLLNRYDPDLPGFGLNRLKAMLNNDMLTVCSDYASVSASINQGLPLRLREPRSQVLQDIQRVALRLVPPSGTAETKTRHSSVFGGIIRALGISR
jgi:pilus assembly protein CpaE